MGRKIIDYKILADNGPQSLTISVQEEVERGWDPHGSASTLFIPSGVYDEGILYIQAMVKYEEPASLPVMDAQSHKGYMTVEGDGRRLLEKRIEAFLAGGWRLHGDLVVVEKRNWAQGRSAFQYFQAMVLPK